MIRVTCKCGFRGQVPPTHAGKQVKCRKCGSMIAVPGNQLPPVQNPPGPAVDESPFADIEDGKPYPDRGRGRRIAEQILVVSLIGLSLTRLLRMLPLLIIVAIVPIAICGGFCAGFYKSIFLPKPAVGTEMTKEDRDEPAPRPKDRPNQPAPEEPIAKGLPPKEPEPGGPPPRGWTVLFRADDPAVWNTASPGELFAMPVQKAHPGIRYLRLKRMDTGEYQVLPITRDQLTVQPQRLPDEGAWWNGTSFNDFGGRHLGIAVRPAFGGQEQIIDVMHIGFTSYSGSGFGHKRAVGDKQYYCWQGKEIPKTVFEIAVTADSLTEDERRFLAAPIATDGAPPKGWVVLFRSDDPNLWNTSSAGENFAIPTSRAPSAARFLRLKRMDTGEAQIIPISTAELTSPLKSLPTEGCVWNGAPPNEFEGRLLGKTARMLGMAEGPGIRFPGPGDTLIVAFTRDFRYCRGSGFAASSPKKLKPVEQQFYTWKGQPIAKTAFEIAVTADALTDQEMALLVK